MSEAQRVRIATRCPACHNSTLMIGDGNWLVCSLIGCPDPTRINSVGNRADSHFDDMQAIRDECDRLRGALERIARYGKDGICPYGCDTPDLARTALTPAAQGGMR